MATVEEWLGPALFKVVGAHLEELGVDEAEDMELVEPDQLATIMAMLKPVQQKKFNKKLAEVTGGAAPAASSQPPSPATPSPSIPEGVAEKPSTPAAQPEPEVATRDLHSGVAIVDGCRQPCRRSGGVDAQPRQAVPDV